MKTIIIYNSQYGSSKAYAEKLQELTGIDAVNYEKNLSIEEFDRVVYVAGLYAGSVTGLTKFAKKVKDKDFVLVTVGIATAEGNSFIQNGIKSQIGEDLYNKTRMFHLMGAIDYTIMSKLHKFEMTMLKKVVEHNTKKKEPNADQKIILESFNTKKDYKNFDDLEPIVQLLKE